MIMEQNNKNTFKFEYGSDGKNNLFKDMNIKSKPLEILIKICTVLNLHTNSLSESNITKDNISLSKQDEIWKKICAELDWKFFK